MPYINEACEALKEGLGTREDIDTTMQLGCNMPMGPLTLADFIGLDTCLAIMDVLHSELGDKYIPSQTLVKYVEAGFLGMNELSLLLLLIYYYYYYYYYYCCC
jgi:3-hydroxybutyryl-CoA dehydrogenase